ncbi:hypothetical protein AAMO2058_000958100 [Amorphochlora amoebiformis]
MPADYPSKNATPAHPDYIVKVMTETYCGSQIDRIKRCENSVYPDKYGCKLPKSSFVKCQNHLAKDIMKLCNTHLSLFTNCVKHKGLSSCNEEYKLMHYCFKRNIKTGASARY